MFLGILFSSAALLWAGCVFVFGNPRGSSLVYPIPEPYPDAKVYEVGPGFPFPEIADVPWLGLGPGDLILIHYREAPYQGIIGIEDSGTAERPIRIYGVPGPTGELPSITGEGAAAGDNLEGFFDEWTSGLGVIVIIGPWNEKPRHIEIANLRITGAYRDYSYTDQTGSHSWQNGSSGLWIKAGNVSIKGCVVTGNGNGIFTQANADLINDISSDILIEGCRIYANGTAGSDRQHNLYIQSAGMTVQFCHIGTLREGAFGSSLKDRSSGTVIRYNMIEASARLLDLVEPEDTYEVLSARDDFRSTWVYGNILLNEASSVNGGAGTLFHYGADNDESLARDGTLYFYGNTVYSASDRDQNWRMCLFEAESPQARIRCFNNVFSLNGSTQYLILRELGEASFEGGNWMNAGWEVHRDDLQEPFGTVSLMTPPLEGGDAGFADPPGRDFSFTPASPCRGIAVELPGEALESHPLLYRYQEGTIFLPRLSSADPGAVEP